MNGTSATGSVLEYLGAGAHTSSPAQRAQELSWPAWFLEEERSRTKWLLALILPGALLALLLDLRLEGATFWVNVSLRFVFLGCVAGALYALIRPAPAARVRRLLAATIASIMLLLVIRYAQGLGLGGTPGHLPADMIVILIIFLLPAPAWIAAFGSAAIAIASAVDYIYWKEVHGAAGALVVVTLLLTWGVGMAINLGRRVGLRARYEALREVYLLRSSIPICAWCKSIRDDAGIWNRLENYLEDHADMMLTHGVCPNCMTKLEADLTDRSERR